MKHDRVRVLLFRLLATLIAFLACPAMGRAGDAGDGIPEITVTAGKIAGYWAVRAPKLIEIDSGLFSGIRIDYSRDSYIRDICLVAQQGSRLAATCSSGQSMRAWGEVAHDRVRFRWWQGPVDLSFDGQWDGRRLIEGGFSGGIAGMRVTGRIPAQLEQLRFRPPEGGNRPSFDVMLNVLQDLHRGALTTGLYEADVEQRVRETFGWPGARSRSPALIYLGQIHVRWRRKQPELVQDVYDVRAGDLVSLCRLALSPRGRVADFGCHVAS